MTENPERGKQGDHGQPGQTGETGEAGQAGVAGAAGVAGQRGTSGASGERGKQGDHGQDGDQGIAGLPGERGYTGQTGLAGLPGERGMPGDPGKAGDSAPSQSRKLLVLFFIMMSMFLLLSVRGEINARNDTKADEADAQRVVTTAKQIEEARKEAAMKIEETRKENVYQTCLNGAAILEKVNNTQNALADLERANIKADPEDELEINAIRRARIQVYERSVRPLPRCGDAP